MTGLKTMVACVALGVAPLALAQGVVYRCEDASGSLHYTNVKADTQGRKCTVVTREISVVQGGMPGGVASGSSQPRAANLQSAPSFPRADADSAKAREQSRRRILEDELAQEERQLADARSKLAEQEQIRNGNEKNYQKVLDRLQPYQDAVERHERNVAALKREITKLQ